MNSSIELISAPGAPEAIGPYSHAAKVGDMIYCSGQIPLDPETKALVPGGIEEQTRQVLKNMRAVLDSQGVDFTSIAKTTIFLTDLADFPVVNGIYSEAFGDHKPARSTIQVAGLPLGSLVEIECIVAL